MGIEENFKRHAANLQKFLTSEEKHSLKWFFNKELRNKIQAAEYAASDAEFEERKRIALEEFQAIDLVSNPMAKANKAQDIYYAHPYIVAQTCEDLFDLYKNDPEETRYFYNALSLLHFIKKNAHKYICFESEDEIYIKSITKTYDLWNDIVAFSFESPARAKILTQRFLSNMTIIQNQEHSWDWKDAFSERGLKTTLSPYNTDFFKKWVNFVTRNDFSYKEIYEASHFDEFKELIKEWSRDHYHARMAEPVKMLISAVETRAIAAANPYNRQQGNQPGTP